MSGKIDVCAFYFSRHRRIEREGRAGWPAKQLINLVLMDPGGRAVATPSGSARACLMSGRSKLTRDGAQRENRTVDQLKTPEKVEPRRVWQRLACSEATPRLDAGDAMLVELGRGGGCLTGQNG
jgi:hypothetical protein